MRALILAALLSPVAVMAHPGVGIVEDSAGNVFYTDLKQVWRIAPAGAKTVAVPNVHTHELAIDADDALYGEHLWYNGEAADTWGHRVWKRTKDGALADVIPSTEGFLHDYSFVRDRSGTMYWADRGERIVVKKRAPDGTITVHATGPFSDLRWMTAAPDGVVYVVDGVRLVRISPDGSSVTVIPTLTEMKPPFQGGLWPGADGSVYVAVPEERIVYEVGKNGRRRVAARSSRLWVAYGGMLDRQGRLWLLETSMINAVRVRRIDKSGKETVY